MKTTLQNTITVFFGLIAAAIIRKLKFLPWKKFYKLWDKSESISQTMY